MIKSRKSWFAHTLGAFVAGVSILALGAAVDANQRGDARPGQVGTPAPDFTLTDIHGKEHTLSKYTEEGKIVVLEWFNPDCPFVVKHHSVHRTMAETYAEFKDEGVVWLAINSGAPGKQGHGHERNMRAFEEYDMQFPLLLEETSEVGRKYGALVTPHMYIICTEGVIRYNGAIDSDRHPTRLGETNYVRQALRQVVNGETVTTAETRAYGCTVKY
ncbi:MAG: thioredoxin family protein [Phycisphaeraceae bacterium]|nr:MAG: thioredoxin family protein [Phycisphaeraceae bacterium]